MKYIIISIMLLVLGSAHAQITINIKGKKDKYQNESKVQIRVTEYSKKIDSVVAAKKKLMKSEIEEINEKQQKGIISEAQAETLKEEVADRYATEIESEVEALQDELEGIVDEQVTISLYGLKDLDELDQLDDIEEWDEVDNVEINIGKIDKKYKKLNRIIWTATLGFSNLTDGWKMGTMNDSHFNFGKSVAFTMGPMYNLQPTVTSPFTLLTGLMYRSNNFRAQKSDFFVDNANGEVTLQPATSYNRLRKAKFRTNTLYIPIGFKYNFRKKQYDEENELEYRKVKKGFYIGALWYGGLNLSNKSIVKYRNEDGNRRKDKFTLDSANDIMYGLEFDFGYRGYNFYMRKDLSDYFDKTTFSVNNGIEFGVRLGF